MIELFPVSRAALQEKVGEHVVDELLQVLSHLLVRRMALLKQLKEDLASYFFVFGFLQKLLFALLPIWRQRRIFLKVEAVIKGIHVLNHACNDLGDFAFDRHPQSGEAEDVLENLLLDVLWSGPFCEAH